MDHPLEHKRHTLAHLLAAATVKHYPHARLTLGPAVDDGFYYDIDFSAYGGADQRGTNAEGRRKNAPGDDDLTTIEATMREMLPLWESIEGKEVPPEEARKLFKGNRYKLEIIDEIVSRGEKVTVYSSQSSKLKAQSFVDLCRGGHSENPAQDIAPDSFKLDRIAGAYWRGDEKNAMLTRIYGIAFDTKKELDAYLAMRIEAKKRDHRKLGKELDLFTFSELVGPGLPLWTPKGTVLRRTLDAYVQELRSAYDFQNVAIPHITKKNLYETSGHWEKFGNELFRIETREGKEFAVKPMNCPHHTQIFARRPHSYKEMPQRFAETTMVYRDEQSGELGGLTRVLSITQDDSHVFCRYSQVKEEFFKMWDIVDTFYGTFGFVLRVRLSFHDPETPEKYLGTKEIWHNAESALREIAQERNTDFFEARGEAALYGPKLDFMATDSIGREHQVATIQLDMNLPERFDLTCINEQGEKERIVIIHSAVMGSIERFVAVLIEHVGGVFPLWLSPVQVKVLPVSEKHTAYAKEVVQKLKVANIRTELDANDESLGKRIRAAKLEKVPYFFVVGDKEVESNTVTVENRKGSEGQKKLEDVIASFRQIIADRS